MKKLSRSSAPLLPRFVWILVCLTLNGCGFRELVRDNGFNLEGSAKTIKDQNAFMKVNLAQAIDPCIDAKNSCIDNGRKTADRANARPHGNEAATRPNVSNGEASCTDDATSEEKAYSCLFRALNAFQALQPDEKQARRNSVQGLLRNASDLRCSDFERGLNSLSSGSNLISGLLTTTLAGVGAIIENTSLTRVFSGSAAIVSGAQAEFNADVFFQRTAPVLIRAIENQRGKARNEMDGWATKRIDQYGLETAIGDAIRYNNACSLDTALGELDKDVTFAGDPGLSQLIEISEKIGKVNLSSLKVTNGTHTDQPDRP
jgi:hypothetical protein